jgi:hypothetical protein
MIPNFLVIAAAALIPLTVGAIWYNPKIGFGQAWMKAADMTEEKIAGSNMALIFGLTYLFSFFIGIGLLNIVIHQMGLYSTLAGEPGFMEPGSEVNDYFENFMATYGDRFRTFKHGALHGALGAIFLALPIVSINALFERKSFKYIMLHVGYWLVSLTLMGGVICQWALPI